jgi:integrase/recombinase XerD
MARPGRRPIGLAPATVDDLREEFLASCRAKNLAERTVEWYGDKTRRFAEWCSRDGAPDVGGLTASHLDAFLIELRDRGYTPQTVRGFAQVVKTLCRFGYRRGFLSADLASDLVMPKEPHRIIPTLTDDQLATLLAAPDVRHWIGVRDRAILLTMADTLARASELATLTDSSVDLARRVIIVMG